jgi:hypothetical protein
MQQSFRVHKGDLTAFLLGKMADNAQIAHSKSFLISNILRTQRFLVDKMSWKSHVSCIAGRYKPCVFSNIIMHATQFFRIFAVCKALD